LGDVDAKNVLHRTDKGNMPPSKRILLIEDDPDYEELVRAVLSGSADGFELKSVPNLSAALTAIKKFVPELILLDLNLTDSSGYETFLKVREHAHRVPIVVLTGVDDAGALRIYTSTEPVPLEKGEEEVKGRPVYFLKSALNEYIRVQ